LKAIVTATALVLVVASQAKAESGLDYAKRNAALYLALNKMCGVDERAWLTFSQAYVLKIVNDTGADPQAVQMAAVNLISTEAIKIEIQITKSGHKDELCEKGNQGAKDILAGKLPR